MCSKLREARIKAGYSIEKVAQQLNIRKQYIICLEEGNVEEIHGKVYVDGYTKMYKKLLGIPDCSQSHTNTEFPIKNRYDKNDRLKKQVFILLSSIFLVLTMLLYSIV